MRCVPRVSGSLLLMLLSSCPGGGDGGGAAGAGTGDVALGTPAGRGDLYARAAVVVGSCLPDDGIDRNNSYLWFAATIVRVWGHFVSQAQCLASHGGGCDALKACIGWDVKASTESCPRVCDANAFVVCGNGVQLRLDCSQLGLTCDVGAGCVESSAGSCDEDTYPDSCDGDLPKFCDDGALLQGPDCRELGLACDRGSCVGTGAACGGGSSSTQGDVYYDGISCEGSTLLSCVAGKEHRLDCKTIADDFDCRTHEGTAFCGLADECTPAIPGAGSGPDASCDGNTVVFCNGGRLERIDCTSVGFTGCDVTSGYGCVPGSVVP